MDIENRTVMLLGGSGLVGMAVARELAPFRPPENGWVDLSAANWRKWRERAANMLQEVARHPNADQGSRVDHEPGERGREIRPGRMAAWIFRYEDRGERIKR